MREVGAARVEVKAARVAVVDESADVVLASIAEARRIAWRARHELEGALTVERMAQDGSRRGRESAVLVEVVVAEGALEAGPYADFSAPVALEWGFGVLKPEPVVVVAEVG